MSEEGETEEAGINVSVRAVQKMNNIPVRVEYRVLLFVSF